MRAPRWAGEVSKYAALVAAGEGAKALRVLILIHYPVIKKRYQKECTKHLATLSTVVLKLGDRFRGAPCSGDNLIKAHGVEDAQPLRPKFPPGTPEKGV